MTETAHKPDCWPGFDVDQLEGLVSSRTVPRHRSPRRRVAAPARNCAEVVDLGAPRAGQGDRMGDRCDGRTERHRTVVRVRRGGRDAPEGSRAPRRDVSRDAGRPGRSVERRLIVTFDDTYRDLASLTELIQSADLVVLPYDSRDQVTSGVLVDAVAAGRPVVSTAFPHAVELLASGAGIVVPQRDPVALGPRDPLGADRCVSSQRRWRPRRVGWLPGWRGRRSPAVTPSSQISSSRLAGRCRRDIAVVRPRRCR